MEGKFFMKSSAKTVFKHIPTIPNSHTATMLSETTFYLQNNHISIAFISKQRKWGNLMLSYNFMLNLGQLVILIS